MKKWFIYLLLIAPLFAQKGFPLSQFYVDSNSTTYSMDFNTNSNRLAVETYAKYDVRQIVDFYMTEKLDTVTLSSPTVVNNAFIDLVGGHGVTAGKIITLKEDNETFQSEVLSVATNRINLDSPLDRAYSTSALIEVGNYEANINGTATRIFSISPPISGTWYLMRLIIVISDNAAMDDAKFGALTELTNGIVLRVLNAGEYHNIFNIKNNGEFKLRAYDVTYTDATLGPGGLYSVGIRRSFNGNDKNGTPIRLTGSAHDKLELLIRDDLTGLSSFKIVVQGYVE